MSTEQDPPNTDPLDQSSYEQHIDEVERTIAKIDKRRNALALAVKPVLELPPRRTPRDLQKMEFPPLRWIVENILPEGLALIGGAPKVGKSRLMYELAIAVACGGVFLGKAAVDPASVLYLALEDNERRMRARIEEVMQHSTDDWTDNMDVQDKHSWKRAGEGGLELIEKWIVREREEGRNPGLVIIDTFGAYREAKKSGQDPYDADYAAGAALQAVALRENISITLIHHTTKARDVNDWTADISGTRGVIAAQDVIIKMDVERGKHHGYIRVTGREVISEDIGISRTDEKHPWTMTKKMPDGYLPPKARQIFEAIQQCPGITLSELLPRIYPEEAKQETLNSNHPLYNSLRNQIGKLRTKGLVYILEYHGKKGIYTEPTVPFD